MAQQNINVGTSANDGTGDTLRDSQIKANSNFTELYTNKVDKIAGKGLSENDFTDAEQTKLGGIESGAQVNIQADFLQDDDTADDYIKNKPDSLYASVGYFHYADATTEITPILLTANVEQKLTNDTLGEYTNISQAPYTVGSVWDASVNSFDFSQMSVGDTIDLRVDLSLTTSTSNTNYRVILKVGEGSEFEYEITIFTGTLKLATTDFQAVGEVGFSLDYAEHLANPASLYIICDEDAGVQVNGWYTRILLKNVNIINFDDSLLKRKSESLKVNDLLLIGSDISIDLLIDGTSYYDFQNSGLVSLVGFETTSLDLAPSPQYPYEGKDFIIRNSTGNSITLKDNYEFAQIPFKLKGAVDVVMPNDSAIWFKLVNGIAEAEEIMRSFGSGIGSSSWGGITGTLADQTDLQSALNAKQDTLISGTNIRTINGQTLLGSTNLVVGSEIDLTQFPNRYEYGVTSAGFVQLGAYSALSINGTQSNAIANTDNSIRLRKILSSATAGSSATAYQGSHYFISNNQGFYFDTRVDEIDSGTASDSRCFYGLAGASLIGNIEPSSYTLGMLGLGHESTDTYFNILYKGTGLTTLNKISLESGFPKNSNHKYAIRFWKFPNTTLVYYSIRNLSLSNSFVTGSFDFPADLPALTPNFFRNNNTTVIAVGYGINRILTQTSDEYV